ncbi:MAG: biotin/lipoyl-binding protein, partial [Chitinophagaceae bacterium]
MQTKLYFPLVLLTFIACKQKEEVTQTTSTTIPVKTIPIEKKNIPVTIQATGIFTTEDETLLSFKTGGILTSVVVKEGDFVRKGQVLATINPTEINTYVQQAQLGLEKAKR